MNSEFEGVLAGIRTDDAEAFLGAGELARARRIGLQGTAVLEPYASSYAREPLTDDDMVLLREQLLAYVKSGSGSNLASAIHALGELRDRSLVPELREMLVQQARRIMAQNAAIGSLICVLNVLGEPVISGKSYSIDEMDKNIADVRRYLGTLGVELPW